jgi:hypothetical protein
MESGEEPRMSPEEAVKVFRFALLHMVDPPRSPECIDDPRGVIMEKLRVGSEFCRYRLGNRARCCTE